MVARKKVFISYRREDSQYQAGRLFDRLVLAFGSDHVFYDVESIGAGAKWKDLIVDRLDESDVVIALIGDTWVEELAKRDSSGDVLVFELQTALSAQLPIIPVLVGRVPMPKPELLPSTLEQLTRLNALAIRPGMDFHPDMDRLIEAIERSRRARAPRPGYADDPDAVALRYGQEQMAAAYKGRWDTDPHVCSRLAHVAELFIGTSAAEQLRLAREVWPDTGVAETTDGNKWLLFSHEYDSGPGRDLNKGGCLALYVVGDSIEGVSLQYTVGYTSSGGHKSDAIAAAGAEFRDVSNAY